VGCGCTTTLTRSALFGTVGADVEDGLTADPNGHFDLRCNTRQLFGAGATSAPARRTNWIVRR
jgi:hypothetical protein